jgi:hypothetical protein
MTILNGVSVEQIILACEISYQAFNFDSYPASFTLLSAFGGGETLMPRVVVGMAGGSLYIVIRGSTEPADFALSLQSARVPFLTGECHEGHLTASRWIITQARSLIDKATGQIVATGHSLGGSCAAIVAAILRLEEKRENVIGIAAATYPAVSAEVQEATKPFVTSLVYGRDPIPQLTDRNCQTLLKEIGGSNPLTAVQNASMVLVGLFVNMLKARGMDNPLLLASLAHQLPAAVPQVLEAQLPELPLRSGGVVLGITLKDGKAVVEPYVEGKQLTVDWVTTGVTDHNQLALIQALKTLL